MPRDFKLPTMLEGDRALQINERIMVGFFVEDTLFWDCVGILQRRTVKRHNISLTYVSGFVEYTCVTSDALSLSANAL